MYRFPVHTAGTAAGHALACRRSRATAARLARAIVALAAVTSPEVATSGRKWASCHRATVPVASSGRSVRHLVAAAVAPQADL